MENLHALICPITHVIFTDPVIGSDCHTYEKSAIIEWLHKHGTSPMTCEPMSIDSLRCNLAIKNVIEELFDMLTSYQKLKRVDRAQSPIDNPPPIPPRKPKISSINNNQFYNESNDNWF